MATKKALAKKVEVAPQKEVVTKVAAPVQPTKPTWEIKDRNYYLLHNKSPLTYTIQSKHSRRFPLLWFDDVKMEQRELRYATNQNSPFRDEQKGDATLGHIIFKNGTLFVPKEKQSLQKILSLYHPGVNKKYAEFDHVADAIDELDFLDYQIDALNAAREMDVDMGEAIMRTELGSKVTSMTSKELKRDLLLFAKRNPGLFLELANDDNVQLRNVAIVAREQGVIALSSDQRTFTWATNGAKLMTVPFDENPYSAMAAYFKTDEGVDVFKSIEKKLK
tara:strand:+ start:4749 stop:5579 length:831 start_codon:yes stop_codon:yes gene_type:complete